MLRIKVNGVEIKCATRECFNCELREDCEFIHSELVRENEEFIFWLKDRLEDLL